ncbi:hypothetical protein [Parafrankia sp. FMc2]|uniref:hypothetical protein n=1 Tax=Parafrankia sp. FMc2 TaxID=3233196 RepID=UPI0034D5D021
MFDSLAVALANGGAAARGQRDLLGYALLRLSLAAHRLRDGGGLLTLYDATHDPLEADVTDSLNPFSDLPVPVATPRPTGTPAPRVVFRTVTHLPSDMALGAARETTAPPDETED